MNDGRDAATPGCSPAASTLAYSPPTSRSSSAAAWPLHGILAAEDLTGAFVEAS
jgi:hypothetical protein